MDATHHLERLAEALAAYGLRATLRGRDRDELRVANPASSVLTETIRCVSGEDGRCCFVWSWGAVIAPADEVALAAGRIAHVLKAVDE